MMIWLNPQGYPVNRKRVQRLMALMGLEAIYPKPRFSVPGQGHKVFPYLLRGVAIDRVDQVWSTDSTSMPLRSGIMYLAAVSDWSSRYVIGWRLSHSLEGTFCLELLEESLRRGQPEVCNTDQGAQFPATAFTGRLLSAGVQVSRDGRGRCLDNVVVERWWRSVKHENVYLRCYETVAELERGREDYVRFDNAERPHQSLAYQTPALVDSRGKKQAA